MLAPSYALRDGVQDMTGTEVNQCLGGCKATSALSFLLAGFLILQILPLASPALQINK